MSPSIKLRVPAANGLLSAILSAIPPSELPGVWPSLERVSLSAGEELFVRESRIDDVYFPIDCVVSFLYATADGSTVAMGMTGNEGMVGLAALLSGSRTPGRAVVQISGDAWKMNAHTLRDRFARGGLFQQLLLTYAQVLLTQISQTAVCNRFHSLEMRFSLWLLLCQDRLDSDVLRMTQDSIAGSLGGRRESVTFAARRLKAAGLICYSRGHIKILDRLGLESAVCECYRAVTEEEGRLRGFYTTFKAARAETQFAAAC